MIKHSDIRSCNLGLSSRLLNSTDISLFYTSSSSNIKSYKSDKLCHHIRILMQYKPPHTSCSQKVQWLVIRMFLAGSFGMNGVQFSFVQFLCFCTFGPALEMLYVKKHVVILLGESPLTKSVLQCCKTFLSAESILQ